MTTRAAQAEGGWAVNGSKGSAMAALLISPVALTRPTRQRAHAASPPSSSTPACSCLDASEHIVDVAAPAGHAEVHRIAGWKAMQPGLLNGGFRLAMQTLTRLRASVLVRRWHYAARRCGDMPNLPINPARRSPTFTDAGTKSVKWRLGIDAAALLTQLPRRLAARRSERRGNLVTAEAAMASMTATEKMPGASSTWRCSCIGGLGVKVGTVEKPVPRHPCIARLRRRYRSPQQPHWQGGTAIMNTTSLQRPPGR
jgi:alkylation response protein AidB-like acyl-CoA dehydrogenase